MAGLALTCIVRDAADCLPRMLESARRWVDAIYATDTGSTDETPDICRTFDAHLSVFTPDTHPDGFFDDGMIADFSAARNFNKRQVSSQYDMLLWLDADDTLEGGEQLGATLEKVEQQHLDGVICEYLYSFDPQTGECNTTHWRERIYRNDPNWWWVYPVHEALSTIGRRLGRSDTIKVRHWRHLRSNPVSVDRNLRILESRGDSTDERICFYLGLEHAHKGHFRDSIAWFERYLTKSTIGDEFYFAHHFLADLHRAVNDCSRAVEYDLKAVAIRPSWKDAYHGLCQTFAQMGDWERAIHWAEAGLGAKQPATPFAINPLAGQVGWVSHYVQALTAVGRRLDALKWTGRALGWTPTDPAHLHNEVILTQAHNQDAGATAIRDTCEYFLRQDDAETAALLLARVPDDITRRDTMQPVIELTSQAIHRALTGLVPPDEWLGNADHDARWHWVVDCLARRPRIRRVGVVGGPPDLVRRLRELGYESEVTEDCDAVILMGALERVNHPQAIVQSTIREVRSGGLVLVTVPDGPALKGVQEPTAGQIRLRVFTPNRLRQLCGTWRLPDRTPESVDRAAHLCLALPVYGSSSPPRTIAFVCPRAAEDWGPWSLDTGIGGSEEMAIRLARTFARRGHHVTLYGGWTPPFTDAGSWGEVAYAPMGHYQPADVLLMWRAPGGIIGQLRPFEAGYKILWLHDSTPKEAVAMAAPSVDAVWCISRYHASLYEGIPNLVVSRNAIDPQEFEGDPARDAMRCAWLSSPFRGLDLLLNAWPKIRDRIPNAILDCYYGFQSADAMGLADHPLKTQIEEGLRQPGIHWHGRIGQRELATRLMQCSVVPYFTRWAEESCIAMMKAQAAGAVPVTLPLGALPETVGFGRLSTAETFPDDVREATQWTEGDRRPMREWARQVYAFESLCEDWEWRWKGLWVP